LTALIVAGRDRNSTSLRGQPAGWCDDTSEPAIGSQGAPCAVVRLRLCGGQRAEEPSYFTGERCAVMASTSVWSRMQGGRADDYELGATERQPASWSDSRPACWVKALRRVRVHRLDVVVVIRIDLGVVKGLEVRVPIALICAPSVPQPVRGQDRGLGGG